MKFGVFSAAICTVVDFIFLWCIVLMLMKSRWFKIAVVVFWLGMMGWFVRYEAFPSFFTHTFEGYRDLFSEGRLFMDSWMKIAFNDIPIGYSHTQVSVDDKKPSEHFAMEDTTELQMNVMGEPLNVSVQAGGHLDILYHLQHFYFNLKAKRYGVRIEGRRWKDDLFKVAVESDAGRQVTTVQIPDDVVLYSPMTELSLRKLKPGQKMRIKTFDPASMTVVDLMVHALRMEKQQTQKGEEDVLVLSMNYQGMDLITWMNKEGELIRQQTPFGWSMESCSADEAIAARSKAGNIPDLLTSLSVPCKGEITNPRMGSTLKLRLIGLESNLTALASERQNILSLSNTTAELLLTPSQLNLAFSVPQPSSNFLAATPFVQSDHPDLIKKAHEITAQATNDLEKAMAIYLWVNKNVVKKPTVSLPSALDVLKQLEGDCNEHTYLFVGLARAAGLPAQIKVGLVYKDGSFYYHAWPAVYVGRWIEMDPTFGQPYVDATHIALVEGEMTDQLRLLSMIGRLKAEVMEQTD